MAEAKKEFLSLEALHFTLLYLRPEGKSVNSPCFSGWGPECGASSPVDSVVVDALPRGLWSPSGLPSSPNHSLQATTVRSRSAAVPRCDATRHK